MDYNKIPKEQLELIEDVVLNRRKGAADELIELAAEIKEKADAAKAAAKAGGVAPPKPAAPEWRKQSVEERLKYALQKVSPTSCKPTSTRLLPNILMR